MDWEKKGWWTVDTGVLARKCSGFSPVRDNEKGVVETEEDEKKNTEYIREDLLLSACRVKSSQKKTKS